MNCVITYRKTTDDGRRIWANKYFDAPSIEAAEAMARAQGIRGEGFEVVEAFTALSDG